jgi:hypothetical protein
MYLKLRIEAWRRQCGGKMVQDWVFRSVQRGVIVFEYVPGEHRAIKLHSYLFLFR